MCVCVCITVAAEFGRGGIDDILHVDAQCLLGFAGVDEMSHLNRRQTCQRNIHRTSVV